MISCRAAVLGCCLVLFGWGKLSISLSTQNTCWGTASEAAAVSQIFKNQRFHKQKPARANRVAEGAGLVSSHVLSAYGGGACMAECITGGVQVETHA